MMISKKSIVYFVFFVIFIVSAFAQDLGCCINPGSGVLACTDQRLVSTIECCPTPVSENPDYYNTENGGPDTEATCLSDFFFTGQSCGQVSQCTLGCCCTSTTGERKTQSECTAEGETFVESSDDCTTVCAVPECNDGIDNDGDGCSDLLDADCLNSPLTAQETGSTVCFEEGVADCNSISYVPEITAFAAEPIKGQKKIILSWNNECTSTLISNVISRCTGQSCSDFQVIGTTPHGSFVDEDDTLRFDTTYTYKVEATFGVQTATAVATTTSSVGDLECLNQFDSDFFCIQTAYYNQYKEYLIRNVAGFSETTFADNVQNTFAENLNKAFFCNSLNTLTEEGTVCGSTQVCVVRSSGPACVQLSDCNPEENNLFGLFFTQALCENNNYCFFDRSVSAVDTCYQCDPAMSCYDYKSADACGRDNCQIHNCEWLPISDELGTGVCKNVAKDNCIWCDKEGTEGVGSSTSTSSIFEQCSEGKAQLLSVPGNMCFYQDDTGIALNCNDVICTDYNEDECGLSVAPTYDEFNNLDLRSNDACGIGTCQWFAADLACKKNANADALVDCSLSNTECEKDVFAPNTTLIPVIDRGIYKSLSVQIFDKSLGSSTPTLRTANNYRTYLCKEPCNEQGHPYDASSTSLSLIISNLKIFDSTTGEVLLSLNEDENTIRYYSEDPAKNIGTVQTIDINAPGTNSGPFIFNVDVSSSNFIDTIYYTANRRPTIDVSFLEDAIITSARLVLSGTAIAISPDFNSNLQKDHRLSFSNDLNPGTYILEINARNEKNIFMDSVFTQQIVVDITAPVVTSIVPEEGALLQVSQTSIQIEFDSPVNLTSALINNEEVTDVFTSDDRINYLGNFELSDGNKQLSLIARDFAGNEGSTQSTFVINAEPLTISILEPSFGVSDVYTFDLVIETDNDATCRYSLNANTDFEFMFDFDSSQGTLHRKSDYSEISDGDRNVHELFVRCEDPLFGEELQIFDLSVDPEAPMIRSAFAFPNPIVEVPRTTELKVETNKPAICKYGESSIDFNTMEGLFDGFANNTFSTVNRVDVTVDQDFGYTYNVVCKGKSELLTEASSIAFTADSGAPIQITSNTLPYSNTSSITLAVETNKNSQCKYSATDPQVTQGTLFGSPGYAHTRVLTLGPGTFRYYVICRDQEEWSNPITIDFTIDTTPPNMLFVDDTSTLELNPEFTWRTDRVRAKWQGEDNQTSVQSYLYTIEEFGTLNTIVNWTISTMENEWVWATKANGGLGLVTGSKYFFRVKAKNIVGLTSDALESDGITIDPTLIPANCTNGVQDSSETDIDCGGPCNLCGEGLACLSNSDCLSGFCNAENICRGPTCTDGVKNQDESDVDCGGTSCPKCDIDKNCHANSDCDSNFCSFSFCKESEACFDGVLSGTESDVDCGGSCPTKCGAGLSCSSISDCQEGAQCIDSFCRICEDNDLNCNGIPDDSEGKAKDTDGDGIPDQWEIQWGLDPNDPSDADADYDQDGLTNIQEFTYKTDPNKEDTDGDGASDLKEIEKNTDPLDPDDKPKGILMFLLLLFLLILLLAGLGVGAYYYYDQYAIKQKKSKAPVKRPLVVTKPTPRKVVARPNQRLKRQNDLFRKRQEAKKFDRGKLVSIFDKEAAKKDSPSRSLDKLRNSTKKSSIREKASSGAAGTTSKGTNVTRIKTEVTTSTKKMPGLKNVNRTDDPFSNLKQITKEDILRKISTREKQSGRNSTSLQKLKKMSKKTKKK